jgi:hypothetical protein
MSDDPKFKNPSITGNFTGGIDWWKCPRCHSEDVFKAKRPMGSVGPISEVGDTGNFIAMQRPLIMDVWVCRPCGETATKFTRQRTSAEKAADKEEMQEFLKVVPPGVWVAGLVMIAGAISFVLLMLDLFS